MDLIALQSILTTTNGDKFCPICGTPFEPYHSRQKTCGSPECKRLYHNQYMRERQRVMRESDPEGWKQYHREAQRKTRAKKRERIRRDNELKQLGKRWEKTEKSEKKMSDYGVDYGRMQAQKTLEQIPKIDVNIGEKK